MERVGENWTRFFSRFFKTRKKTWLKPGKNPEKNPEKKCRKMWRVRRMLGIWWCRDGPGTYHSRTCQGKSPEKTRFNFSPTPSSPTPFFCPEPMIFCNSCSVISEPIFLEWLGLGKKRKQRSTESLTELFWALCSVIWEPRGPGEASWCREANIAARQFLPLNCRAITEGPTRKPRHVSVWTHALRHASGSRIPLCKGSGPEETSWCLGSKIAARQFLPLTCRAITPSLRGQFWKRKKCPLLWGRGNLGGILRDNLGEGNWESKIAARQWGVNFCREASRCLAGSSGWRNYRTEIVLELIR